MVSLAFLLDTAQPTLSIFLIVLFCLQSSETHPAKHLFLVLFNTYLLPMIVNTYLSPKIVNTHLSPQIVVT